MAVSGERREEDICWTILSLNNGTELSGYIHVNGRLFRIKANTLLFRSASQTKVMTTFCYSRKTDGHARIRKTALNTETLPAWTSIAVTCKLETQIRLQRVKAGTNTVMVSRECCFSETLSINHLCMPGWLVRSSKRPVDFNTPEKNKREFLHGFILVFSRADGVLLALCMENEVCRIPLQESLTQLDPSLKFFHRISASSTSRIENFKW